VGFTGTLRSPPPLWVLAAVLVLGEVACALCGARSVALSALALLAPGWALAPLLPGPIRRHRLATIMAAPALGLAVVSSLLITLARVGIPLTDTSVQLGLVALVAVGILTWTPGRVEHARVTRGGVLAALGLLAVIALSLVLALRVLGSTLVPGNDWAKYLLYADEIRRQGSMLIMNPFWMLGVPFRDDPGGPALYGSVLLMSHAQAGVLSHGILVFVVLEVTTVFAFARAFWGRAAGVLAAALVAVVPASQDILGWEGVANLLALVLLPLLFAYLAAYATGQLDRRGKAGLAFTLIGLVASHRLSGAIGIVVTGVVLLACCAAAKDHLRAVRDAVYLTAGTLVVGVGVLADLYARERTFGGSLPYTDYLDTKINLTLALRDISPVVASATAVALVVIAFRHRGDRALWPSLVLLVVSVALGYGWILHVANYYSRMVFYVPLVAAILVAAVAVRLRWPVLVAGVCIAGIAATTINSYPQAKSVRSYYSFVTPAALRGLNALTAVLRPNEVVVTDRCWSFLGEWLLSTRTLAALLPEDIQPAAELKFADEAKSIIHDTRAGRRLGRALGVRFLLLDPTCPGADGGFLKPPRHGTPVFESTTLAIVRLPASE
jgi:hypothetical protein